MISVIITTYNQSKEVEKCVTSIVEQKLGDDFEIIVLDDASLDGTVEIIRKRFADRVKIVEKSESLGWLDSCKKAVELAEGEVLVFFDPHCLAQSSWLCDIAACFKHDPMLIILTGPANHGKKFMQKLSALTFHSTFVSQERKYIDYIFDDNFAIKKDVLGGLLKELPVDKRVNDGVGSTLLSGLIKRKKLKVLYEPRIGVSHLSPSFFAYLKEWAGFSAETTVEIRRLDSTVRGAKWLKTPVFAALVFAMGRFLQDVINVGRLRRELSLSIWEIPALLVISFVGKICYFSGILRLLSSKKNDVK